VKSKPKKSFVICPRHTKPLVRCKGPFGYYWRCTVSGCDILCGNSPNSTPAGKKTRVARRLVHEKFDNMWHGKSKKARSRAYQWLQETMDLTPEECHVGLFDLGQCHAALDALQERQDVLGRALGE